MNAARPNRIPGTLALVLLMAAGMPACKKATQADLNPNLNVANDILISERPLINSFTMLLRATTDTLLQLTHDGMIQNAWVTYNPGQMQYSFKYFGTASPDGVVRSGRIDAALTGDFFAAGTSVKFTFQGYTEDGMPISGIDSLLCTDHQSGLAVYRNSAVLTIIKDTIGTIHAQIDLKYRIPLYAPMGYENAVVQIEGSDSGTSSKGYSYLSSVSDTLSAPMNCPWICSGSIGLTIPGAPQPTGVIVFVSGQGCSDRVDYQFGETVYQWKMEKLYLLE